MSKEPEQIWIDKHDIANVSELSQLDPDYVQYIRSDIADTARREVWAALEQSVKLQSHYAKLLNMHDGGERLQFHSAEEWVAWQGVLGR